MARSHRGVWFWSPRILTLLFALFLSLFALDVFGEATGFVETMAALTMHLIPTFLVIGLLAVAWQFELVGVVAFAGLAVAYDVVMWGRFPALTYVMVSGPLLLISGLFFVSWWRRRRLVAAAG